MVPKYVPFGCGGARPDILRVVMATEGMDIAPGASEEEEEEAQGGTEAAPAKGKRKRTRLTKEEKLALIKDRDGGLTVAGCAKKYKVVERQVRRICNKERAELMAAAAAAAPLHVKTTRAGQWPQIEERVVAFVRVMRQHKKPVGRALMQERGLAYRDELLQQGELSEKEREELQGFSASLHWVDNLVKRHSLTFVSNLHGEGGSVDEAAVRPEITKLTAVLATFLLACIYNVDETGLFFRLLPRRSYITTEENRKTLRGTKGMKAKDRITAFACTNAAGDKVPMAIIGSSQKPRCFALSPCPLPYLSQAKAWADAATFKRWYVEVFLPYIRRHHRREEKVNAHNLKLSIVCACNLTPWLVLRKTYYTSILLRSLETEKGSCVHAVVGPQETKINLEANG
jgi:hypothetical protein